MKQLILSFFLTFGLFSVSLAQEDIGYQKPHKDILQWADVKLPPSTSVNDAGTMAILRYRDQYKSIEELSQEELRLAGLRINPKTNIGSRTTYYNSFSIYDLEKGKEEALSGLPENVKLANLSWSPNQQKIAFTNTTDKGVELWMADVNSGKAKKLTADNLNANMGRPYSWFRNGEAFLVRRLPENRGELIDNATAIPTGPTVSKNDGSKAQNRTYQDLLKNKNDEHNFELLTTAAIDKVDLKGNQESFLDAGMYRGISFSPNGEYVLMSEMQKPFSYIVTYGRFPYTTTVYSAKGKKVEQIASTPLEEERPKGFMSTSLGMRDISWRADKPATLYWVEALDEGDANKEVEYRDVVKQWDAPFKTAKSVITKTKDRFSGIAWGDDSNAIMYDWWWNTRNVRYSHLNPSKGETREILSRNYQDVYSNPGSPVTAKNDLGRYVLAISDGKILLNGPGISEEGTFPFIDEFDLQSFDKKRLWQASATDQLEGIVDVIDAKKGTILQRIESKSEFPNYYIRNIRKKNDVKQVTNFANPFGNLKDIHKEVITYKREDGLELNATLYLPAGYDKAKKDKLPMLLWAYPREFKDKSSAGQVTASPNEFTYPWYGSPIFWVNRGYAVLDDASFPIIGEGEEEPNDTFRDQLVGNAKAAIDAVDEMGYIDRNRVGVGGHSYGAFMTANLLSHSNLFAAGIARSGAYNRTLTPFGFQSEERSYWEAPEVYYTMSPFMHADKMKTPLLLIHGEADNNSGTYPMQSERYFNALKGLGATVRLVMLPKESHGYRAEESVLHVLWEQDQWLEKYVKNKEQLAN